MKPVIIMLLLLTGVFSARAQSMDEWLALTAQSPAVLAAQQAASAARESAGTAGFLPDPMVNAGITVMPMAPDGLNLMPRLTLMQTFPWPGTLSLEKEVALTEAQIVGLNSRQQIANLQQQMREALLGWLWQRERQRWLREQSLILKQWELWQQQQVSANRGSLRDVLALQRNLLAVENDLAQSALQQQSLAATINRYSGRAVTDSVVVTDTLTFPEKYAEENIGTTVWVAPWQQQESLAQYRGRLAELQGKPMWGIGLDYMILTNPRDKFPAIAGRHVVLPMFSVSLPVYRRQTTAAIQAQSLYENAAQLTGQDKALEVEMYRLQQEQRWEQARISYQNADNQLQLLQQQIQLLEQAISTGEANRGEWLQWQLEWNKAQLTKVEAIYNAHMANASLLWIHTTVQP